MKGICSGKFIPVRRKPLFYGLRKRRDKDYFSRMNGISTVFPAETSRI
jgi:hypothetical protein